MKIINIHWLQNIIYTCHSNIFCRLKIKYSKSILYLCQYWLLWFITFRIIRNDPKNLWLWRNSWRHQHKNLWHIKNLWCWLLIIDLLMLWAGLRALRASKCEWYGFQILKSTSVRLTDFLYRRSLGVAMSVSKIQIYWFNKFNNNGYYKEMWIVKPWWIFYYTQYLKF